MKRFTLAACLLFGFALCLMAQSETAWSAMKRPLNFFLVNDMGRNGYYDQKPIAQLMGQMAEEIGPECVVAVGDVHHFWGVASTQDPLWMTNYEQIYTHPELMIPWYPALGNHEYRGSTQAVLDYAHVSRRWMMPARNYTKRLESDGVTLRLVVLDTTPLIARYREETDTYPDAAQQDATRQMAWLDSVLTRAAEDWVVVVGHHPIYAETPKSESERSDMQAVLDPVLRRHRVDLYVAGHIHNFQHVRKAGSPIDYVVNSSASLARKVKPVEGTVYCSPEPGFSVVDADKQTLSLHFIDKTGRVLHSVVRRH